MSFRRSLLLSALAYSAITLLMGREVLASLSTTIAGDRGDPILNAGILVWNARNIPWTDAWYDFPSFYPTAGASTFSEHLLGLSVIATPLYWLTGNALTTYNVTLLATYILCGVAMFALVWRLTGHAAASFLAGMAYAFAPYRAAHIGHIQILAAFWAPLALIGLHAFVKTGRRAWLALFAACWMLQGAANSYLLVFFSVLIALYVSWFVIPHRRWSDAALIGIAAFAALIPLVPILLHYIDVHGRLMLARPAEEIVSYSADITAVLCGVPRNPAWGWFSKGVCGGERELFPGVTLLALCVIGAILRPARTIERRPGVETMAAALGAGLLAVGVAMVASAIGTVSRGIGLFLLAAAVSPALWRAVRSASIPGFYLVMAAVTWAFTWGPSPMLYGRKAFEHGPYAWLMLLPGVTGLRVPARFWLLTVLCLSVAMGVLVAAAFERRSRAVTWLLVVIGACGLTLDGWTTVPAVTHVPSAPRPDLLRGGIALTLPLGVSLDRDAAAQLEAVDGGWVAVNGYSGYEPPHYELLRRASRQADAVMLSPFLARGDLNVIMYDSWKEQDALVEGQAGARLVGKGNGLRQYHIPRQGMPAPSAPTGERLQIASVSVSCAHGQARLVTDDDSDTRWSCGPQQPGQALTAHLREVATVAEVVPALGVFRADYPTQLTVETSLDGETWDEAWNRGVLPETFEALVRDPAVARVVLRFQPRLARHVRLRLTTQDDARSWSVAELEVWSGPRAAAD